LALLKANRTPIENPLQMGVVMGSKDQKSAPRLVDANSGVLSLSADGSVNWPRTLRLAKHASGDGVTRAVVTTAASETDVLLRRMPHLSGLLQQHSVSLAVTPAVELSLQRDLFEQVVHLSTILGGLHRRHVLLRIPCETTLPILPVVDSLRRMRLSTILLAPERCDRFRNDASELKKIVSLGGLVQLSAASLTDQTDRRRIGFCRHLIRQGLCHFVASESGRHHDLPISLSEAYRVITKWVGHEVAAAICCHNPSRLFDGDCIEATPRRRSLLKVFLRAA
jgi:protein-tyrosine phosphatase